MRSLLSPVVHAVVLVALTGSATDDHVVCDGDAATCDGEISSLVQRLVHVRLGKGAEALGVALCMDATDISAPMAALHAVWTSDFEQAEGLKASIASAIDATSVPLVAHVLVEQSLEAKFQRFLGLPQGCRSARLGERAMLQLHDFDADTVRHAEPVIPQKILERRGGLDAVENFARFYMHKLIPGVKVAVYLDADTIVQSDLAGLRDEFIVSNKTIGFAQRGTPKCLGEDSLGDAPPCDFCTLNMWQQLRGMPEYNAGVYIVDLERWARRHLLERVENLARLQSECDGGLWEGGSQPLLLMALYTAEGGLGSDIDELEDSWNTDGLGWMAFDGHADLKAAKVLHWSGSGKPWLEGANYASFWRPHRERYDALIHSQ